jgi:hypothetical protein
VLYTTGISNHFYEEHYHVQAVIGHLKEIGELGILPKPQLVVRTYVKGTSQEMKALAARSIPDVIFPPVLWDEKWQTPQYEDLTIYTNLVRHTDLGINAASTVSLELLLHNKPVINLDFDPPGTDLPWCMGYSRHINFDHYKPVAESGATMVARSEADMREMLYKGLTNPQGDSERRRQFMTWMFGDTLDGNSGRRVAEHLIDIATIRRDGHA